MSNRGRGPEDLDQTDLRILQLLQHDAKDPNSRLARDLGLSQSSCWRRVRRLEKLGFILGYRAELDRDLLGDVVFEGETAHDAQFA